MDPVAHRLRTQLQAQTGFWAFPHEPTIAEPMPDPGLLILGNASQSFLLPGYNLKPLTAIDFSSFVITLLIHNPSLHFNYATITALWTTLVLKVYHFEWEDIKSAKLREVPTPIPTPIPTPVPTLVPTPTITGIPGVEEQLRQKVSVLEHKVATLQGLLRHRNG